MSKSNNHDVTDCPALIATARLERGAHKNYAHGVCAMELVSYISGEEFSDHPQCVCLVLSAFVRAWNDGLEDDERNAILKPLLPRLVGTRGSDDLAKRRALMAADWVVRAHAPAWLRLAKLDTHADSLASLPEITAMAQIPSICGLIEGAAKDAAAAGDAATDAAWAAARDAAWAATDPAWAARAAAATDAATAAAWAATWAALKPTRDALVKSAAGLLERMIDARSPA